MQDLQFSSRSPESVRGLSRKAASPRRQPEESAPEEESTSKDEDANVTLNLQREVYYTSSVGPWRQVRTRSADRVDCALPLVPTKP